MCSFNSNGVRTEMEGVGFESVSKMHRLILNQLIYPLCMALESVIYSN